MNSNEFAEILFDFRWSILSQMHGLAHNSIVGFISSEWLKLSPQNMIFDGAPAAEINIGRKGHRYADIILVKQNKPLVVVEVETSVKRYKNKLESIAKYILNDHDYPGLEIGLMILNNLGNKYKHKWDCLKKEIMKKKLNIALVSIEKDRDQKFRGTSLENIQNRNDYYKWRIANIEYWVHFEHNPVLEGRLY